MVLPAPLGPTSATSSPGRAAKLTWDSAGPGAETPRRRRAREARRCTAAAAPAPEKHAAHVSGRTMRFTVLRTEALVAQRVVEGDVVERDLPRHVRGDPRRPAFRRCPAGRSSTSNTRSKLTMDCAKATGAPASDAQRAVELPEVRAERDDRADGEDAPDDEVPSGQVHQRRPHGAGHAHHGEEAASRRGLADADAPQLARRDRGSGPPRWRAGRRASPGAGR